MTPTLVHSALVGKVHELKGQAFMIFEGQTTSLKVDSDIEDGADILVSDEASMTVGDFFDRRHHLGGGTNLTMQNNALILKKGAVWSQSVGSQSSSQVSTANMVVLSDKGEWVTTYDPATRKTQLTAISGEVRVASPQEPAFQYAVSAGMFTVADPKLDEGYPRSPTKLGYDSLMKTLAMFPGTKSRDAGLASFQSKQTSRGIASVQEELPSTGKGQITFISKSHKAKRIPASLDGTAQKYFMKKAVKKKSTRVGQSKATMAPVRIIGSQWVSAPAVRKPASIPKSESRSVAKPSKSLTSDSNEFLKSFELHMKAQPKNPAEVQRLIDDLQSY